MLRLEGTEEFISGLQSWIAKKKKEAVGVFRGVAVEAYFELLGETPQWTGNAVANWNFGVGEIDTSVNYEFTDDFEEQQAIAMSNKNPDMEFNSIRDEPRFKKGDTEAIAYSIGRSHGKPASMTLATDVYLSNSAESITGKSYIRMLESNQNNFLRTVNEPGHMVENAVKNLGRNRNLDKRQKAEYIALGKKV